MVHHPQSLLRALAVLVVSTVAATSWTGVPVAQAAPTPQPTDASPSDAAPAPTDEQPNDVKAAEAAEDALAPVLARDLGMSSDEFNRAGTVAEAGTAMIREARKLDGFHSVRWDGKRLVLAGTGPELKALASRHGAGFVERPKTPGIESLSDLVSLYTSMVGNEGVMFIGVGADGYVIKVREPEHDPDAADPSLPPEASSTPTPSPQAPSASASPEPSAAPSPSPPPPSASPEAAASAPSETSTPEPGAAPSSVASTPEETATSEPAATQTSPASPSTAETAESGFGKASGGTLPPVAPEPTPTARPETSSKLSPAEFGRLFSNVVVEGAEGPADTSDSHIAAGQGWGTSSGLVCSLGFPIFTSAGQRAYLTAGHCADGQGGAPVYARDPSREPAAGGSGNATLTPALGNLSWHAFGGQSNTANSYGTDLALMNVTSGSYYTPPMAWKWSGSDKLIITGVVEPVIGMPVCRSGRTTGWHCGTIAYIGWTYVNNGGGDVRYVWSMMAENLTADKGDSGGPWMTGFKAVGIMSAIGKNSEGTPIATAALVSDLFSYQSGMQLIHWLGDVKPQDASSDGVRKYRANWRPGQTISGTVAKVTSDRISPDARLQVWIDGKLRLKTGISPGGAWAFTMPEVSVGMHEVVLLSAVGFSKSYKTTVSAMHYPIRLTPTKPNFLLSENVVLKGTSPANLAGKTAVHQVFYGRSAIYVGSSTIASDGSFTVSTDHLRNVRGRFNIRTVVVDDGVTWTSAWVSVLRGSTVAFSLPGANTTYTYGFGAKFSGQVIPARATTVQVQYLVDGVWTKVGEAATDSAGRYLTWIHYGAWEVKGYTSRVVPNDDPAAWQQASFLRAGPVVGADPWPYPELAGAQYTTMTGRTAPGVDVVMIGQRMGSSATEVVARGKANRHGVYSLSSTYSIGKPGDYRVRVEASTPAGNPSTPWVAYTRVPTLLKLSSWPSGTIPVDWPAEVRGKAWHVAGLGVCMDVYDAQTREFHRDRSVVLGGGSFHVRNDKGTGTKGRFAFRIVIYLPGGESVKTGWRWFTR